jgi:hypothetical protein
MLIEANISFFFFLQHDMKQQWFVLHGTESTF